MLIDPRYCGPPTSSNGGYVAGRLAALLTDEGPVSVMLRQPPPLGRAMSVVRDGDGVLRLMDGARVVAEAALGPAFDGPLPEPVTYAQALEAGTRYAGLVDHPFPTCFSCGTDHPNGLHLQPGSTGRQFGEGDLVAAAWIPTEEQTGQEFAWVALDCPGAWAGEIGAGRPAVLGRITASVTGEIQAGEEHVVLGWKLGSSGRKTFSVTALYGPDSSLIAVASAIWITVDPSSVGA